MFPLISTPKHRLHIGLWSRAWNKHVNVTPARSPFDQLHSDEVVPVAAVEDDETIGGGGLELKEEVHCGVGLQSGQAQVAALGFEGDRVGDDEAHPETRVELAEVDVSVLAHVDVLHAVELQALWGESLRGGQKNNLPDDKTTI